MLKIDRESLNRLDFDLEEELRNFAERKRQHAFTVDIPGPTAHPLVEAVYAAGGFQVTETPPSQLEPAPQNLFKAQALERLSGLPGKSVDHQLQAMRELLLMLFASMPD